MARKPRAHDVPPVAAASAQLDEEMIAKRAYLPLSAVDAGDDLLREIRRATKKPTSWAGLLEIALLELLKRPDRLEVMIAANRPYRREKNDS